TVIHRHARRNAMLPMITVIILAFAGVFSGAILTETVFSWPGMGRAIYEAIQWRDTPMMESCFFIMALLVVLANFIADVVYGFLDPRIRY
ncbi:MAG TPA: ABC transporter permease, partial [Candidatus Bathyarchaeota archaeon]|nr:ABC transporter permease [Candidatus Bathyarchaeota archaeon]